ncbi:MAG: type II toxin-antitoxin system VapC family toxin [Thermoguttaceae bacterium]|jgi:predicted nucleic acid-binding protein|nr:type II toxin-antitoxin system VapC family toxin [Thermoguttaceae bacterium]
MVYIDTSVLVACYCPEPRSSVAEEVLHDSGGAVISRLVELEFCSAVALKLRMGEFDRTTATRVTSFLRRHLEDEFYAVVPIGSQEYEQACDWIGQFSTVLRAPDALHLAAAHRNNLLMATADQSLARAAAELGVKHKLIA